MDISDLSKWQVRKLGRDLYKQQSKDVEKIIDTYSKTTNFQQIEAFRQIQEQELQQQQMFQQQMLQQQQEMFRQQQMFQQQMLQQW